MMVTVTQTDDGGVVDKFPPILGRLEAKGVMPEEKIATYKTLTEKLHKDNFQAFLKEFSHSGSRLVNTFCIDVMSTTPDISQAALQAVGFCIYHDEIISILSASDVDILLKALQNVLLKTSDKGTCTRALWCVAKQSFPVDHVKEHLHGLLCSLEHVLVNGEFKSVTVEHEAINAIIKLLESIPNEMLANTLRWAKLILPSLVHSAVKVRTQALTAFELALPAMMKFNQELASTIVHSLKTNLITEMNKLFACKHELYVLKIWGHFVTLLGKTMHRGGSLINLMLGIVEQGFKHQVTEIKIVAFYAWKILIQNFALDSDVLYNQKRIKLLVQPFKVNNAKTESVATVKFEVWWFLIKTLGPKAAVNFDQVCAPLLQFALGLGPSNGVHLPTTPGTKGMKNLLSTPVHRKGSATPATPTLNLSLGSPGPVHPVFKSIQLKGVEALAHILGKWDSSVGLPKPNFTLVQLDHEIVTSPTLFNKLGHTLLQAATMVCCSLATDVAGAQIFHIWYSIVAHLKNLIDNTPRNESSDMLSHFFMCIQSIVKAETLPRCTVLRLLEAVSALPKKALSSSFFTTGTVQLLHGTPALFLVGLLFSDCLLQDLEERFFCIFEALVDCGMTSPGGALGFSQSVLRLVDSAASKVSNKEHLCRLWNVIVSSLLTEIKKTNEVNQGDSLEHDFSTMFAALTLPVKHMLPNAIPLVSQKNLVKIWSELYRDFSRCSSLVATAEANHSCEELATKINKLLDDNLLSNSSALDALSQLCLVIIQNFDFSALSNENQGLLSPYKRPGLSRRPLGNLTSLMKLLCQVLYAINKEMPTVIENSKDATTKSTHLVSATTISLDVLVMLISNLSMSYQLISLLDKVAKPLADFCDIPRKFAASQSQISAVEDKLKKVLVDLFTSLQNKIKCQFDNKLLAIMSPILEQTLSHPKRSIKSQTILFWNNTFGKAKKLDYPEHIKPILKKVRDKTLLSLPSWAEMGLEMVEETPVSQLMDINNTQSFVEPAPIIRPFGSPSPHKMHGSFLRKETEKLVTITSPRRQSPARVATASPNIMAATKGTRRCLNIDEDSKLKFVKIAPSPKKKLLLTEHQKEVMRERGVVPTMYNDLDQSQDTQLFSNVFSQTQDSTTSSISEGIQNAIKSCEELKEKEEIVLPQHPDFPLLEEAVDPEFFWKNSPRAGTNESMETSKESADFTNAFGSAGSFNNGDSANSNNAVTENKTDTNVSSDKENKMDTNVSSESKNKMDTDVSNKMYKDVSSEKENKMNTNVSSKKGNKMYTDASKDKENKIDTDVCSGKGKISTAISSEKEKIFTSEKINLESDGSKDSEIKISADRMSNDAAGINAAPVVSVVGKQDVLINTQNNRPVLPEPRLTPEKKSAQVKDSSLITKQHSTPEVLRIPEENLAKISSKKSKAFQSLDITSSPKVFVSQSEKESTKTTKSVGNMCHSKRRQTRDNKDTSCKHLTCTQDDLVKLAEKFEFDDIRPLTDDSENEQCDMNTSKTASQEKTLEGVDIKAAPVIKDDTPLKRSTRNKPKTKRFELVDENNLKSVENAETLSKKVSDARVQTIENEENESVKSKGRRGRKRKNSGDTKKAGKIEENKLEKEPAKLEKRESKRRKKAESLQMSGTLEGNSGGESSIQNDSSICNVEADNISFNSCEDMFEGMGSTQEVVNTKPVDTKDDEPASIDTSPKTKLIKTYGKEKFNEIKLETEKDLETNLDNNSDFESEDDLTLAEIKECYLDGDSQESTDDEVLKKPTKKAHLLDTKDEDEDNDCVPSSQPKNHVKQTTATNRLKLRSSIKKKSPESVFSKKALKLAMKSPGKRNTNKSPVKPNRTSSGRLVLLPRRLRSQTAPVAARLRSKSGDTTSQNRKITPVKRRCSTPKCLSRKKSFFDGVSNEPLNSQEYKIFSLEETICKEENTLPVISESPEKNMEIETDVITDVEPETGIDLPKNTATDSLVIQENIPNICESLKEKFEETNLLDDFNRFDEVNLLTQPKLCLPDIVNKKKEIDKQNENETPHENEEIKNNIEESKDISVDKDEIEAVVDVNNKDGKFENCLFNDVTISSVESDTKDVTIDVIVGTDVKETDIDVPINDNVTHDDDRVTHDDDNVTHDNDNVTHGDAEGEDDIQKIFDDGDEPENIIDSSQSPVKSMESEVTTRIDVLKQALSQIQESTKLTIGTDLANSISTTVENLPTSPVIPVKFCEFHSPPEQSSKRCDLSEHAIPGVFSPSVSPSSGILKRQPGPNNSPSPRTRRVSFAEPIEQLDSDAKAALTDGGKNVNRCLEMNRQHPTSPLVTTTPSKVVNVNSRYITTPSSSRRSRLKSVSCGGKRYGKSPTERRRKLREYSHASPRLVRKAFHLNGSQVSQDSPLTQGSPGSGFDSDNEKEEFDPQQAVFPQLTSCTDSVVKILPKLTSSMWSRGLGQLIRARNIITVGHLSALTPTDLKTLPIRSPKVKTVKRALETFHQQLIAKEEKVIQQQSKTVTENSSNGKDETTDVSTNVEKVLNNTGKAITEMDNLSQTLRESSPAKLCVKDNEIKEDSVCNDIVVHEGSSCTTDKCVEVSNKLSLKRKLEESSPIQSPKKCKLIDNLEELTNKFVNEDLSQLSSEQIFRAHQQVSSLMTSIVQALRSKCQSPK